jgi:CheY-like chemotaxis protein
LHFVSSILRKHGFNVLTASSGAKGLNMLTLGPGSIQVVLLDYTMPRLDGDETLKHLRNLNPSIKVVAVTVSGPHLVSASFRDGVDRFIEKPIYAQELIEAIDSVISAKPSLATPVKSDRSFPAEEATPLGNIRILIIDDSNTDSRFAKGVLEQLGCTVQFGCNPVRALETYAREKEAIDLVLVDYFMPTLDGGATVDHLRMLNPDVKVVLFSGAEEIHLRQIVRKYGIEGYIHKPMQKEEALRVIREILPVSPAQGARI